MNVFVLKDEAAIGKVVGDLFCDKVLQKPNAVLGLATGATPLPTYQRMAKRCKAREVSFKGVTTFNLDEYCDLPVEHPNSYRSFMRAELFDNIDIDLQNTHFLDGNTADEFAQCAAFDALIEEKGGIDLQLLGIGRNGHIGFNEPANAFTDGTFKVELTPSTIAANSIYFTDVPMPRYAMTMGVGSILRAKEIVLVATGSAKAEAVKAMVEGAIDPQCPASALQKHENVAIYLDPAAAALLSR